MGRVCDRSYAGILAFELDVDPIAAHTCVRISVGQQNGVSWFMVEMCWAIVSAWFRAGMTTPTASITEDI
jgi:hypothetical protein